MAMLQYQSIGVVQRLHQTYLDLHHAIVARCIAQREHYRHRLSMIVYAVSRWLEWEHIRDPLEKLIFLFAVFPLNYQLNRNDIILELELISSEQEIAPLSSIATIQQRCLHILQQHPIHIPLDDISQQMITSLIPPLSQSSDTIVRMEYIHNIYIFATIVSNFRANKVYFIHDMPTSKFKDDLTGGSSMHVVDELTVQLTARVFGELASLYQTPDDENWVEICSINAFSTLHKLYGIKALLPQLPANTINIDTDIMFNISVKHSLQSIAVVKHLNELQKSSLMNSIAPHAILVELYHALTYSGITGLKVLHCLSSATTPSEALSVQLELQQLASSNIPTYYDRISTIPSDHTIVLRLGILTEFYSDTLSYSKLLDKRFQMWDIFCKLSYRDRYVVREVSHSLIKTISKCCTFAIDAYGQYEMNKNALYLDAVFVYSLVAEIFALWMILKCNVESQTMLDEIENKVVRCNTLLSRWEKLYSSMESYSNTMMLAWCKLEQALIKVQLLEIYLGLYNCIDKIEDFNKQLLDECKNDYHALCGMLCFEDIHKVVSEYVTHLLVDDTDSMMTMSEENIITNFDMLEMHVFWISKLLESILIKLEGGLSSRDVLTGLTIYQLHLLISNMEAIQDQSCLALGIHSMFRRNCSLHDNLLIG